MSDSAPSRVPAATILTPVPAPVEPPITRREFFTLQGWLRLEPPHRPGIVR